MEDYKIILYILLGVAYLIYTNWRKAFKGPDDVDLPEDKRYTADGKPLRPQRPQQPATSFEDILRELQPKAQRAKEKGEQLVTATKEKSREGLDTISPAPVIDYDNTGAKVLSWEKPAEARQALRQSQQRRESSFKAYEKSRPGRNRYQELLSNPNTAREAFILSEIFQRKYD
ncbi:hypothetical protein I2I11_10985 [Pontibacter sp. 172403-2]|uniref:hypothetical protein n=1 Tax=Pontibacter rufus TaxID=2791028 RepID=UPI0018AF6AF1|nr:hypothetical protein [Pontibacter sp. 172403-2]MBF9253819.1 hypothetical protein [Pontibacter sp. 172403-2]